MKNKRGRTRCGQKKEGERNKSFSMATENLRAKTKKVTQA